MSSTPMSLNTNEPLCPPRQCHWTQMNLCVVHANVTEHKWTSVSSTTMSLKTNEPLCRPRQCHWKQMNLYVVHDNVTEHKWTSVSSTTMSLNTNELLCRPRQCHWKQCRVYSVNPCFLARTVVCNNWLMLFWRRTFGRTFFFSSDKTLSGTLRAVLTLTGSEGPPWEWGRIPARVWLPPAGPRWSGPRWPSGDSSVWSAYSATPALRQWTCLGRWTPGCLDLHIMVMIMIDWLMMMMVMMMVVIRMTTTTVRICFIHPSGKLKLSFDRTKKNISQ